MVECSNPSALWVWHLERNCLVHRVGIGRLDYSRRYQDPDLEIVLRFSAEQKRGDTCRLCKSVMLAQFGGEQTLAGEPSASVPNHCDY